MASSVFSCLRTYAMHERAWHVALVVLMLSLVPVWIYIVSLSVADIARPVRITDTSKFRDSRQDIKNFVAPIFCQSVPKYASALNGQ